MHVEEVELSAPRTTALLKLAPDHSQWAMDLHLTRGSNKRWSSILLFLAAILPVAVLIRLIGEYGVNVPYGDDWSLIPPYGKWTDPQLPYADLSRPRNEH